MVSARDNSVKEQFNIGDFEQKATKVEDMYVMINFISQSIWPQFSISIMLLLVLIGIYWSSLVLKIARNWIPEIIVFFQCLIMYSALTFVYNN